MYESLKSLIVALLKVEAAQPHPPAGYHRHEMMRVERAAPAYLALRLFIWKIYAALWALGILTGCAVLVLLGSWWMLLVFPLLAVAIFKAAALYVVSRLDYEMRWYVITERSLLIREGVWEVREITLTFANAQNVRITQGPVERLFGISNVEVDTAGGGGGKGPEQSTSRHTAVLRGLSNPAEVRDLILGLLRQHQTAGLGDPDDLAKAHSGGSSEMITPSLVAEILNEAKGMREAMERRSLSAGDHQRPG
jgi:membrane protein YdbS with pleckstrin-like domain